MAFSVTLGGVVLAVSNGSEPERKESVSVVDAQDRPTTERDNLTPNQVRQIAISRSLIATNGFALDREADRVQALLAAAEKKAAKERRAARVAAKEARQKAARQAARKEARQEARAAEVAEAAAAQAVIDEAAATDPGTLRDMARQEMLTFGFGADQWTYLDRLVARESGWNPLAENPSSGAYGLPQSLPGSKMATEGPDWRTNPVTQIRWMLKYIADRYGNPEGAWAHSENIGWY